MSSNGQAGETISERKLFIVTSRVKRDDILKKCELSPSESFLFVFAGIKSVLVSASNSETDLKRKRDKAEIL